MNEIMLAHIDGWRYRRGVPDPRELPAPPHRARGGLGHAVRCPVCRRELIARVTAKGVSYPCNCKP